MLATRHMERYAEVLLWALATARKKRLKKGDLVLLRFHKPAIEQAEVVYRRLLASGFNPVPRLSPTTRMEKDFFQLADNRQLAAKIPGDDVLCQNLAGAIYLHAPESITHLQDIDSKRISRYTLSRKYLRDILDRREAEGSFGWTLCILPTRQQARHAGLTLQQYSDQVIKACFLHRQDPVAQWKKVYRRINRIKKWLNSLEIDYLHVESKNVDLKIVPGRRRIWAGLSGHNIPSFEIFLSPDWRGTKGYYFADQPTYRSGNYVAGIHLEFSRGSVVRARAEKGDDFLQGQLAIDRGARRLGEFSLTDRRFSKIKRFMANTLFDENFGGRHGNCHIALGASYTDTFAGNPARLTAREKKELGFNDSALHWDLVNTESKRVTAKLTGGNKTTIYENGIFKV